MKIGCITKNTTAINTFYTELFSEIGYTIEIIPLSDVANYNPALYDFTVISSVDTADIITLINTCYNAKHKFAFATYSVSLVGLSSNFTYGDNSTNTITIGNNAINGTYANSNNPMHNGSYISSLTVSNSLDNYVSLASISGKSVAGIADNYCFIGFLPWNDTTVATTAGKEYAKLIFKYFLENNFITYYIEGTIKDKNGNPLVREIRVYNQSNGILLGAANSNSAGKYTFKVYDPDTPLMVVCVGDRNTNTQNSVVYDNIIPLVK